MSEHPNEPGFSARTPFGFLLGLLSVVLLPVALTLAWLAAVGTRADLFVDTLGPVVRTQEVQQSLAEAMTNQAMSRLRQGERERAAVEPAVREAVTGVVAGERFADIWADAVRQAHRQLVARLTTPDDPSGSGDSRGDERAVVVSVALPLDAVQARLTNLGVTATSSLNPTARVPVLTAGQVDRLRPAYAFVSTYGPAAPFVAVALGVLAVAIAVLRRRAALWLLVGWGFGLALLAVGLALARPGAVKLLVRAVDGSTSAALPLRMVADAAYTAAATSFERWLVVGGVSVAVLLVVVVLLGLWRRSAPTPAR